MTASAILLPDGTAVPRLGLGTWRMGDGDEARSASEVAALQLGFELGLTLVDTAEMYGDGRSERLVGRAIAGRRDAVTLVSKVLPSNATRAGIEAACGRSLKRLGTDRLDIYLLHWRGGEDLGEVVQTFEALRRKGDILHWGVSNFDTDDLAELDAVYPGGAAACVTSPGGAAACVTSPGGGAVCVTNQVLYNPGERGIEFDLMPAMASRTMPVMAYSPVGQGGDLLRDPALGAVAGKHGVTPAAVALAWTMRRGDTIAIPKASDAAHVRANAAAAGLVLDEADLAAIDRAFPPPRRRRPLAML